MRVTGVTDDWRQTEDSAARVVTDERVLSTAFTVTWSSDPPSHAVSLRCCQLLTSHSCGTRLSGARNVQYPTSQTCAVSVCAANENQWEINYFHKAVFEEELLKSYQSISRLLSEIKLFSYLFFIAIRRPEDGRNLKGRWQFHFHQFYVIRQFVELFDPITNPPENETFVLLYGLIAFKHRICI